MAGVMEHFDGKDTLDSRVNFYNYLLKTGNICLGWNNKQTEDKIITKH